MNPAWLLLGLLASFQNFPVNETFSGKPAAPILRTRNQRTFRTVIREAAAKGPNFAGHYTIAQWGCGGGCVSMAVIDAKSGRVTDGPFKIMTVQGSSDGREPLDFRIDSRLLIARGCPEEKNCASYFYEWTGTRFRLIRSTEHE